MNIKIYGSRGSAPHYHRGSVVFGGNTSCVRVNANGRTLLLDCGSGILSFAADARRELPPGSDIDILIGHLHLDHIIGLTAYPALFNKRYNIRIFTRSRSGEPLVKQLFGVFKPPYWPVDLSEITTAQAVEIGAEPFTLGNGVTVSTLDANHEDDATSFRIDDGTHSLVYLLDYEVGGGIAENGALVDFCMGADVIIFDNTFLPADYKKGWGHSVYTSGVELAEATGCKRMLFSHNSQRYSDDTLSALQQTLDALGGGRYTVAYDGMEVEL